MILLALVNLGHNRGIGPVERPGAQAHDGDLTGRLIAVAVAGIPKLGLRTASSKMYRLTRTMATLVKTNQNKAPLPHAGSGGLRLFQARGGIVVDCQLNQLPEVSILEGVSPPGSEPGQPCLWNNNDVPCGYVATTRPLHSGRPAQGNAATAQVSKRKWQFPGCIFGSYIVCNKEGGGQGSMAGL